MQYNALESLQAFELGAGQRKEREREAGRMKLGNALAGGDYKGGASMAYGMGDLETGMQLQQYGKGLEDAEAEKKRVGLIKTGMGLLQTPREQREAMRPQLAQTLQQFGVQLDPQQLAQMDLSDEGIRATLTTLQDTDSLMAQYQGMMAPPEYGAPVEALGPDGKPAYVQWSKTGQAKPMEGYMPPSAAPGYEQLTLADGEYEYIPGQPETLRKLGDSPVKSPLVSIDNGKGDDAFQGAVGKTAGERYYSVIDAGQKAATTEGNLQAMETLLNEIDYTGFGGTTLLNVQRAGAMVGLQIGDDVAPKEAAQRLSNELALGLKENLPGPMSNADREFLLSIPPNLNVTDAGNDALIFLLRQRTRFEQAAAKSLLEANPQSLQEYQQWERNFQMEYGPVFTPEDKAQLLKDMTGVR